MNSRNNLLQRDRDGIDEFLKRVGSDPERCRVGIEGGDVVYVNGFPLSGRSHHDAIDIALLVQNYPNQPPIGIYVLNEPYNRAVIATLRTRFSAFGNKAFHGAPVFEGYVWICYQYENNVWRFNYHDINLGDNLAKFLQRFHAECKGV